MPTAAVHGDQEEGLRKYGQHRIRQGIGMNYLCELQTKSEEEAAIGRCDLRSIEAKCWFEGTRVAKFDTHSEGLDRPAHGGLPLGLVRDQSMPPCAQIR